MDRLERYWYSINPLTIILWPLSLLFAGAVTLRRLAYHGGLLKSHRLGVPVIVVGNISVGGNGKTPLVMRVVEILQADGYRPGIISRGYGGTATDWPRQVTAESDPREVGDEPVLLARRCRCPVVVAPDRVAASQTLLKEHDCDVLVADDGLQHYRLARDIEIAVVDVSRLGNGACLPAGPLREPHRRLRNVDFIVGHGMHRTGYYSMLLTGERAVNLTDPLVTCVLAHFRGDLVHAVAGIGHPARFFHYLEERGIRVEAHPFPDHHHFEAADLDFADRIPVLMTEKDAVKCGPYARDWFWYVPVRAQLDPEFEQQFLRRLSLITGRAVNKPKV